MNTRFEPIPLYNTPCNNCGKLIKDHFDGYCEIQKPKVTSPLSDDELSKVWGKAHEYSDHYERRRAIAIAAKMATMREIAAMPSVTTLTDGELVELTPMGGSSLSEIRRNVANAAIAEFQKNLLAGIGETK